MEKVIIANPPSLQEATYIRKKGSKRSRRDKIEGRRLSLQKEGLVWRKKWSKGRGEQGDMGTASAEAILLTRAVESGQRGEAGSRQNQDGESL